MIRCVLGCVAVAACGRIGFDPIATSSDGRASSDDARRDGNGPADGSVTACTTAIPIELDVRTPVSTCSGHDLIDGCGPPATQEVVFAFTAPASAGYQFQAYDPGTDNISNSTGVTDATCTLVQNCSGILGISVNAGATIYLVVEAASGGCASIEFEAM